MAFKNQARLQAACWTQSAKQDPILEVVLMLRKSTKNQQFMTFIPAMTRGLGFVFLVNSV
jgi:hypothetical protein